MKKKYSEEVEKLFKFGKTNLSKDWPDYAQVLNIGKKNADELIDIVKTHNLSHAVSGFKIEDFAPRHAWRALGQLKITESVPVLLDALLDEKNEEAFEFHSELPKVLVLMGFEIIPDLEKFIKNPKIDWDFKVIIFKVLVQFALQSSKYRDYVVIIFNELFIKYHKEPIFISRLLNELFKLDPIEYEVIKEIIKKDQYDYGSIDKESLIHFIKLSKLY
ncbi:hypothetical protein [Flavobacterium ginsenosidimutans]|uniref:HEAT repeat domain-containing protein n=1 Tax=Flavobacterium ginsenosidimutans TaxID=687844 RepID=A0ABZ2Q1S3_9FLAO|nr:hypothetical protein [Flavobacterium ginsenosidimutans]KAF2326605.1 hypothetical protein DM444_22210 [Flavobacterium ginsenosidimutans]